MTIAPIPTPPERAAENDQRARSRVRYDWSSVQLDEWQTWQDRTDEEIDDAEALRSATRIRVAALDHAARHGLKVESRRKDHGRVLDLRFTEVVR